MPRRRSTKAAQDIIDNAQAVLSLELVVELAEPLARYFPKSGEAACLC
jgi:hypothetical protein